MSVLRGVRATGLTQSDPRNVLPAKRYEWRGIPGWNPADAPPGDQIIGKPPTEASSRPPRPVPTACGTKSGYEYHRRNHTQVCDPCKLARAEYRQLLKLRKAAP